MIAHPRSSTRRESQLPDSTTEISVARLFQIRRDEEAGAPAAIVVQLAGLREGREVSVFAQQELVVDGEHALVSRPLWDSAERLLPVMVGATTAGAIAPGALRAEQLPDTSESQEAISVLFTSAMEQAVDAFFTGCEPAVGGARTEELSIHVFYDRHLESVIRSAVEPAPAEPEFEGVPANSFQDAPYIAPLPKDGTKGFLLEREALQYGMSSTRFPNGAFVVEDPAAQRLAFKWGRSPLASGVALSICSYKEATRRLLERFDIPVPRGRVFSMDVREQAMDYADRVGYPVVCKPVAGLRGIGVVTNIGSRGELKQALELYSQSELGSDDFVIEEQVPGEDYRIVIIGDEVVASVVRAPASVVGDGVHTVFDLIEYKNRARKLNPHLSSRLIKLGASVEFQLQTAGLDYASVPLKGERVLLANSANLSQGGDSFEIADEIHPSIKELAVKAVQAVPGLGFCGLDMLIEDHRKPVTEQRVTVIELNAHAAIGSAQYPMWGTPYPVAERFFRETAARAEISLPENKQETLSVRVVVRGAVTGVGYRRWLAAHAESFDVKGFVKNEKQRIVEAHFEGSADAVAALCYLAINGPRAAVPTSVTVTHARQQGSEAFEIKW